MDSDARMRLAELREALDSCAKPLRDPDLLRWAVDELIAILLDQESAEETKLFLIPD